MDFIKIKKELLLKKSKEEIEQIESIESFDVLKLASMGSDDSEGYQIFTPDFVVEDMVKRLGLKLVTDFAKTILEPTSGDGAFTTHILLLRLQKALKDKNNGFEINSLKALSTIYSIEMDKSLILKQRNNILTVFKLFGETNNIKFPDGFLDVVKIMIQSNFIWAMFNADEPVSMLFADVAFKMPEAENNNFKPLDFPVWEISESNIDFRMEGVDIEYD